MPFRARTYIGSSVTSSPSSVDAARVGRGQPDDHVERRGLAGAVRAEQADDLARADVEADAAHHGAAAVGLREIRASGASPLHWRPCGGCTSPGHRWPEPRCWSSGANFLVAVDDDPIGRSCRRSTCCRSFRGIPRRSSSPARPVITYFSSRGEVGHAVAGRCPAARRCSVTCSYASTRSSVLPDSARYISILTAVTVALRAVDVRVGRVGRAPHRVLVVQILAPWRSTGPSPCCLRLRVRLLEREGGAHLTGAAVRLEVAVLLVDRDRVADDRRLVLPEPRRAGVGRLRIAAVVDRALAAVTLTG